MSCEVLMRLYDRMTSQQQQPPPPANEQPQPRPQDHTRPATQQNRRRCGETGLRTCHTCERYSRFSISRCPCGIDAYDKGARTKYRQLFRHVTRTNKRYTMFCHVFVWSMDRTVTWRLSMVVACAKYMRENRITIGDVLGFYIYQCLNGQYPFQEGQNDDDDFYYNIYKASV